MKFFTTDFLRGLKPALPCMLLIHNKKINLCPTEREELQSTQVLSSTDSASKRTWSAARVRQRCPLEAI